MSFTPDELKKYVTDQLNQKDVIPSGHKGVFGIYVDDSGARVITAWKTNNEWQVIGQVGYHPHEDGLKVGLNIMKTW